MSAPTEKKKGMFEGWSMKPVIVLETGTMSDANIKALRDNHLCVVVAKDPTKVRFLDPIPAVAARSKIEDAAIRFSRKILKQGFWTGSEMRKTLSEVFIDVLIGGTPLDPEPSQADQEKQAYDFAKIEEMRRLGREDAKTERAALKAAKSSTQPA